MKAVQIVEFTGPAAVIVTDVAEPVSGPDEVLVEVHAAGVSFPELLQTRGLYQVKPELPYVPGSEVAGIVREAPAGAHVQVGDRVAGFAGLGGYAQLATVPLAYTFPIPDSMSFEQAAGLPMNYLTMQFGLVRRGHLQPGETVLVHGAGGGIGTATIQLATAYGARVIAVVSSESKAGAARAAGATDVVLTDGFKDAVAALTDGRGVDMVVDPVGGDLFTDSLRSLTPEGRLLVIGFTGGEIPTVRVNRLLLNNISVVGVGMGALIGPQPGVALELWKDMYPLLEAGRLDPVIAAVLPLDDAAEALSALDERRVAGKIILSVVSP